MGGSLSMAMGHSDPYERTYSNIPRGYERTYSNLPRGYKRTYSNDEYYPSQHDKYPPMKLHEPKYPSPKPSAWKKEKTPKPTAWKSPKPKKTPKPTKAEKTPKPTLHKMEKTPKPTVWKSSDYDKEPKHYSMNEEENKDGDKQNFFCMLDDYQPCTRAFQVGPNAGCLCKSGCCEGNWCVPKKRDWLGVPYCPSECRGTLGGELGTC